MSLANLLTCSRAVLAVLFSFFLLAYEPFGKFIALLLFIIASLTDYWDGRVARQMGEDSRFGRLMDPIADKILTLAAFLSFWKLGLIPFWMVAVVMARDVFVTTARLLMPRGDSQAEAARPSGKQKTVLQIIYIIAVLLYLIARQFPQWRGAWEDEALFLARAGMLAILVVTLFSGFRVWTKNVVKGPVPREQRGS